MGCKILTLLVYLIFALGTHGWVYLFLYYSKMGCRATQQSPSGGGNVTAS